MIKKFVRILNIFIIYMYILNVCVCNEYLLNEYECIYINIYEVIWIYIFNLINICFVFVECKFGLKSDGNI